MTLSSLSRKEDVRRERKLESHGYGERQICAEEEVNIHLRYSRPAYFQVARVQNE